MENQSNSFFQIFKTMQEQQAVVAKAVQKAVEEDSENKKEEYRLKVEDQQFRLCG